LRVIWNQQAIDDRIAIMEQRSEYVSVISAIRHDDLIEAKGENLSGVVTYKKGRVRGTYEYVFSDQYIMVYLIKKGVFEILTIVPTAVNWANSAKKIKALI
jgi:hypothetical protein